jgi:uncharacterized protein (DUF302 family)
MPTMPTSQPRAIPFTGVRIRHDSAKPYEELVRALLADVGDKPVMIDAIASDSDDWDTYREAVQSHVGAHGFMLFGSFDHGEWLTKAGVDRKVLRVIVGNPLIAITMLRHDVTAGLFAPVELLVVSEDDNRSSLTYVQPSSLMVVEPNAPLLEAALDLDAKLAALAHSIV